MYACNACNVYIEQLFIQIRNLSKPFGNSSSLCLKILDIVKSALSLSLIYSCICRPTTCINCSSQFSRCSPHKTRMRALLAVFRSLIH